MSPNWQKKRVNYETNFTQKEEFKVVKRCEVLVKDSGAIYMLWGGGGFEGRDQRRLISIESNQAYNSPVLNKILPCSTMNHTMGANGKKLTAGNV